jgi:hypothetical protein
MKFTPWQLVAVLAILLTAIIVANRYAPGAVATVVSMATTVFAALFVGPHDDDDGPPPGSPPVLRVIAGGAALALAVVACGLKGVGALQDPSDDEKLATCRADGRRAARTGSSAEEAWDQYLACMRDAGIR